MHRREWSSFLRVMLVFLLCGPVLGLPRASAARVAGQTGPGARLKVVASPYEPYVIAEDGHLKGLEVDLLDLVCAANGWTYQVEQLPFAQMLDRLEKGEADVGLGAIYRTPGREVRLLFTDDYVDTGLVVVTRATRELASLHQLAGWRVGVKEGATGQRAALRMQAAGDPSITVVPFGSTEESFAALRAGTVDAVFNDYLNSLFLISRQYAGELTIAKGSWGPLFLSRERLSIAFGPGREAERADFDRVMAQLKKGGTLSHIRRKWLPQVTAPDVGRIAGWIFAAVAMVTLIALIVLWALRRKLRLKFLRDSERRYRDLIEKSPLGICLVRQGTVVYANQGVQKLFGCESLGDLSSGFVQALIAPGERQGVEAQFREGRAKDAGEQDFDTVGRRKDGSLFPMHVRLAHVDLQSGPAFLAFLEDVTERKRAEAALRESETRLRLIVDNVHEIIYYNALEGDPPALKPLFASRQLERILGYPPDYFKRAGHDWIEAVHPEDRNLVRRTLQRLLTSPGPATIEYRFLHRTTGQYHWVEDLVVPRLDGDGQIFGFFGVARDVTDRRGAETAERRRHRQLLSLVSSAQAMGGFLDLRGAARSICEAALLGVEARMAWIGLVVPESVELEVLASAGMDEGYTSTVHVRWDESAHAQGPTGRAIKSRLPVIVQRDDPAVAPWKEAMERRGFLSICALPLLYEDTVRGALTVYGGEAGAFTQDAVELLEIFARQAAMAVVNASLYGEATATIEELAATNRELQRTRDELLTGLDGLRRSKESLRASEEAFRVLGGHSSDWVWEVGADLRFTHSNAWVSRLLGYRPEEILGRSLCDLMPPAEARQVRSQLGEEAGGKKPLRAALAVYVKKDGAWMVLVTSAIPIRDASGTFRGYWGIGREAAGREAEESLRRALRAEEESREGMD
ncbi:MAG: PAS domain S-box protein [Acidobacteriota bacterium]